MMNLYNTQYINWAPYSIDKTIVPDLDIKSSEYVFCCMIDAIRKKHPFSVVRMGDGEAGLMKFFVENIKPAFLQKWWFDRIHMVNVSDQHIKAIGEKLIYTANHVDFLASSIWGSSQSADSWSIDRYISRPKSKPRCSNWFNFEWMSNGCANALVSNFSFGVLHNNPKTESIIRSRLAKDPRFNNKIANSDQFLLLDDTYVESAVKYIANTNFDVYLISGGPTFKSKMYDISQKYNKVLLDIGAAMSRCWARDESCLKDS